MTRLTNVTSFEVSSRSSCEVSAIKKLNNIRTWSLSLCIQFVSFSHRFYCRNFTTVVGSRAKGTLHSHWKCVDLFLFFLASKSFGVIIPGKLLRRHESQPSATQQLVDAFKPPAVWKSEESVSVRMSIFRRSLRKIVLLINRYFETFPCSEVFHSRLSFFSLHFSPYASIGSAMKIKLYFYVFFSNLFYF